MLCKIRLQLNSLTSRLFTLKTSVEIKSMQIRDSRSKSLVLKSSTSLRVVDIDLVFGFIMLSAASSSYIQTSVYHRAACICNPAVTRRERPTQTLEDRFCSDSRWQSPGSLENNKDSHYNSVQRLGLQLCGKAQ